MQQIRGCGQYIMLAKMETYDFPDNRRVYSLCFVEAPAQILDVLAMHFLEQLKAKCGHRMMGRGTSRRRHEFQYSRNIDKDTITS
jgi:hypothetical protein